MNGNLDLDLINQPANIQRTIAYKAQFGEGEGSV